MSLLGLLTATAPVVTPPEAVDLSTLPGQDKEHPRPYPFPSASPWTVPNAIITPTPYDTTSAVHPSVVDMVAETGKPFRGWRYWLAITPYEGSNDQKENPCILVSNHGWDWQVPAGLTNPLDDPKAGLNGSPIGGYNSDTELVWDPEGSRFVLYWRRAFEKLHAAESKDGIHWTYHWNVLTSPTASDLVSPSLVRRGAGDWYMWAGSAGAVKLHMFRSSSPLGPWASVADPVMPDPGTPNNLWHHSVNWDPGTQHFFMLGDDRDWALFPAVSADGITWKAGPHMLRDGTTYRATMVPSDDPAYFDVWYSYQGVSDLGNDWWTKYTRLPRSLWTSLI